MKKRKSSRGIAFFLCLIAGILLGGGGACYYLNEYKVENTPKQTEVKEDNDSQNITDLRVQGLYIKNLVERYDYVEVHKTQIALELYRSENFLVNDFNNYYVRSLIAKNIISTSIGKTAFDSDSFQETKTLLFGKKMLIRDGDISSINGCESLKYNEETKQYRYETGECGGTGVLDLKRAITNVTEKNQILEVEVAVVFINTANQKVYKVYDYTKNNKFPEETDQPIEGLTSETLDMKKDIEKLDKFKYVFNYDKDNNNYYLNRIEYVK